ncbi:hypothetical protein [Paenibacillus xylanilyticus]|uniref:Uncharacterized protein n=1 Tax=Paenibacillus xylanilyticus TaxID=248903 RepID=A0A7Y6BTE4_9BACL|nr:hypothetical protein [Paenibacillus xylanilyticus]NUU74612.1 hypothetical protein [Paenibacillus xylanilyticus]
MQYYPMPDHVRKQCNYRFSYTVIVSLFTSKAGIKDYLNKNVRINNDEKLGKDELTQRAASVVEGFVETLEEFNGYDSVQVAGITFASAYDKEF